MTAAEIGRPRFYGIFRIHLNNQHLSINENLLRFRAALSLAAAAQDFKITHGPYLAT